MSIGEWPGLHLPLEQWPTISTWAPLGCGQLIARVSPTSTVWSAANRAIYSPVRILVPTLIQVAWWVNGATVSGNVDVGLYDRVGTRLLSTGSTVQSGTSQIQSVDIADVLVGPGVFYVALAVDNVTATVFIENAGTAPPFSAFLGLATQDTAFPLPATATFASHAVGHWPQCGFSARTVA